MFPEVTGFIYRATDEQIRILQKKANSITGEVSISDDVTDITNALKNRLNLKTVQTALARRLAYTPNRRHYKHGTTMIEDILNGNTRRHANSYK